MCWNQDSQWFTKCLQSFIGYDLWQWLIQVTLKWFVDICNVWQPCLLILLGSPPSPSQSILPPLPQPSPSSQETVSSWGELPPNAETAICQLPVHQQCLAVADCLARPAGSDALGRESTGHPVGLKTGKQAQFRNTRGNTYKQVGYEAGRSTNYDLASNKGKLTGVRPEG